MLSSKRKISEIGIELSYHIRATIAHQKKGTFRGRTTDSDKPYALKGEGR